MCLKPKVIRKSGKYKKDNYRGMEGEYYEISTYTKCGCCSQCLAERANNWVVRNHYESKIHKEKCFITLTYAENPIILVRKDLQDFIKRFRFEINKEYYKKLNEFKKKHSYEEIKEWKKEHQKEYIRERNFYVGEYGTIKNRPHYHVIVYGWEDKNAKYIGVNKKTNILYQSKIIQECWGLGRTTYQKFGDKEIPYIALYNTQQEEFKKAYKMTREKAKQIENKVLNNKNMKEKQRRNLLEELKNIIKQMDEEKAKYMLIKEFNGWSTALGWEQFQKEYIKQRIYTFEEQIEDCTFATPSPWVKKLANEGDIQAANEMFRREKEIIQTFSEEEEATKNHNRIQTKRKKEHMEWHISGRKNGEIEEL